MTASGLSGSGTIIAGVEPVISNPGQQLLPAALVFVNSAEYQSEFVAQEYELILHRTPEASASSYWTAQMQAGLSQEGLTADLLSSAEFVNASGGGELWIKSIYQRLFDRPADANGLAFWDGELKAGMSDLEIAKGFTGRAEWIDQNISDLYANLLGRPVDQASLSYWQSNVIATGRIENVTAGLLASSEFYTSDDAGDGTPLEWIDAVYALLFNRQASTSEETYWLGQV